MATSFNISYPLEGLNAQGKLSWANDNESVRQVIWNILMTQPGERLMRPEFGAGLKRFIHRPNNQTTRRLMADVARQAIERWETRIALLEVQVISDPANLNQVTLAVHYRVKFSGAPGSLEIGLQLQS